jgi:hypothetical protein
VFVANLITESGTLGTAVKSKNCASNGISSNFNDGNHPNAEFSIRVKREFDSNVTETRRAQDAKQYGPRISTLRGITIDWIAIFENASVLMDVSRESDSNKTLESR